MISFILVNFHTFKINYRVWPQYVRERIHDTYAYFGGSVAITAATAAAVFRSPALMNIFARTGWVSMLATIALMMGSGMVARSIPYEKGFGTKQLAWITHCAIMVMHRVYLLNRYYEYRWTDNIFNKF